MSPLPKTYRLCTFDGVRMEVGLIWLKGRRLSPLADALRKYLEVAVGARTLD